MFLIFDVDSFYDGAGSGIAMFIQVILCALGIGLPILYFTQGGVGAVFALILGLALGNLIYSLVTIVSAIKKLKTKANVSKKIKNLSKLYLILFVVLSIIGYIFPIGFNILTYRLDCMPIFSMLIMPLFLNIIYLFLINTTFLNESKIVNRIVKFISDLFISLRIMIKYVMIPLIICFFAFLFFDFFTADSPNIKTSYDNFMDKCEKICLFEDMKYDTKRNEYQSTNEFLESFVIDVKTNLHNDQELKSKAEDQLYYLKRKKIEKYWNDINNANEFAFVYISSFLSDNNKNLNAYGIRFEDAEIVDLDTIIVHYYDLKYLKDKYCKIDLTQSKVLTESNYYELYMQSYHNRRKLD